MRLFESEGIIKMQTWAFDLAKVVTKNAIKRILGEYLVDYTYVGVQSMEKISWLGTYQPCRGYKPAVGNLVSNSKMDMGMDCHKMPVLKFWIDDLGGSTSGKFKSYTIYRFDEPADIEINSRHLVKIIEQTIPETDGRDISLQQKKELIQKLTKELMVVLSHEIYHYLQYVSHHGLFKSERNKPKHHDYDYYNLESEIKAYIADFFHRLDFDMKDVKFKKVYDVLKKQTFYSWLDYKKQNKVISVVYLIWKKAQESK